MISEFVYNVKEAQALILIERKVKNINDWLHQGQPTKEQIDVAKKRLFRVKGFVGFNDINLRIIVLEALHTAICKNKVM